MRRGRALNRFVSGDTWVYALDPSNCQMRESLGAVCCNCVRACFDVAAAQEMCRT